MPKDKKDKDIDKKDDDVSDDLEGLVDLKDLKDLKGLEDLKDEEDAEDDEEKDDSVAYGNFVFTCPKCGEISQDDVVFLCNTCERSELMFKDGLYICPSCLVPGKNFQCMLCDSKDVVMTKKNLESKQ